MEMTEMKLDRVDKMFDEIWNKFLGLEIAESTQPEVGYPPAAYFAWVRITGNENITIILKCPESLAKRTTAAMYEAQVEEVDGEQVQDCMKEIVNILAGHLKGTMTHYHLLSIPFVSGPGRGPNFPKEDFLGQFFFRSLGQDLQLTLLRVA